MRFEVAHAIPGRVRLRIPDLRRDPNLAETIATAFARKPGVTDVRVNSACGSVVIGYDTAQLRTFVPESMLNGLVFTKSGNASLALHSNGNGQSRSKRLLAAAARLAPALALPTAALAVSLAPGAGLAAKVVLTLAASVPVFRRALDKLVRERQPGVDLLDATAISILTAQGSLATSAFMAWLIGLGEHIRTETALRTRKAVAELISLHSGSATLVLGRQRKLVPVERVARGDLVAVNAGDIIPVDGTVERGEARVDQAGLTGESAASEKSVSDAVYAGSVALDGELFIRAQSVGKDTRLGTVIRMLNSAPEQETCIGDYAARFADRLVLPTFALSGLVYAWKRQLARALSMLIVDFGTGIRVAAPTAFLSFMTCAARRGIVIKSGRALEKLAAVDTVVFDKTGTLTTGSPRISEIIAVNSGFTERTLLKYAAAAEMGLNHPIAAAVVNKTAELNVIPHERSSAALRVGLGVMAEVHGRTVIVGSGRLMIERGVDIGCARAQAELWSAQAMPPLYVAVDGKLAGFMALADTLRPESAQLIKDLRDLGIGEAVILTGDCEAAGMNASRETDIGRCICGLLPDEKMEMVRQMRRDGHVVAVIGDGVNDTLALMEADVAVAPLGATDAAKEASDVLLMEDDLRLLTEAFTLSTAAVSLVRQNFGIVAAPNALAIGLAALGLLNPAGATLINNGSTVAAGLNSLRPMLGNGHKTSGPGVGFASASSWVERIIPRLSTSNREERNGTD